MLEKSFGLLYYLKQTKNQKNENRYIYLRITVDGERREISTKRQWIPEQWNTQLGRTTGISEEAKELNSYLDLISVKVYRAKTKLLESNQPLTADNIKDVLTGNNEKKYFIVEAFMRHNKQMKALVGREIAPATLTRYRTACDHVQNFIKWKYKKEDLELRSLGA
ncbi:Arm DNA-binding domain-containing protein [Mucilaginibacter lappiensis]|uniref:Arm DNA-binding domain-containing protein n=1 Tax=Mucilaginibacter lappiensis TaxID=354630 RepID=UPI003D1F6CE2